MTSSLRVVKRITRSFGRPASTWITPPTPLSATRAPTAVRWSVSSVTIAEFDVAVVTTPTRPSGLTTGWFGRTPSLVPLLMSTWLHQTLGSWPMTRAATGPSSVEAAGLVEVEQAAQLVVLARGGGAGDGLLAQRVALGAQLLDLALGVDRVADPADEVAHGLERPARPLLDRGDDLDDAPLHGVQPAAGGLAEVGGEEDQGAGDKQSEDCPASADRLVVHVESVTQSLCGVAAARSSSGVGCDSSNSCSSGG